MFNVARSFPGLLPLLCASCLLPRAVAIENSPTDALLSKSATWLLRQAHDAPSTQGATWPQFAEHPFTTDSLYSGTAGVIASLLTLSEITGDPRHADAAQRGVRHLLASAVPSEGGLTWDIAWDDHEEKVHHSRRCGLYNGTAGIAWTLLNFGDLRHDPKALDAGKRGFDWLCHQLKPVASHPEGKFWDEGELDVISGSAGIILALLDAHRITGERRYQDAAILGAEGLLAAAHRHPDGWSWNASLKTKTLYSGFSHGTAGIGGALARLHAATGDPRYLQAAREAARWLDRNSVRLAEKECFAWRRTEGADAVWEGWCHGPAGTCRLHLLLHSLTGEPQYLAAAEAGARWIMERCDPDKDRREARFFAPSLCCGAAGVGTFMLDLHRYTNDVKYLAYAQRIVGFLDRVADKPALDEACWSLSGRPEKKSGKVYHGTNLMTGQGGYITFLARLKQQQDHLVREVVVPPDWATVGLPPGRRLLVVELGSGADRFHTATRRLASYRGVEWERLADASNPDALRDLARRQSVDALALVVAPEVLDINLNRRVLDALCHVDDDIFPDATYGYLTGAAPADVMAMLDNMAVVERDGLPARGVDYGIATTEDLLVYPEREKEAGISWTGVYIPTSEKCPAPREKIAAALAHTKGAGIVSFSGNGDPMRVWLFSGQRNMERKLHWAFDPARIIRDYAHAEMPAFGASEFGSWDLAGRVVSFSTCHSGVPVHAMIAGDIVSTFGRSPDRSLRFYDLLPEESLCLKLLARGPSAYFAPIGPNHGYLANAEMYRATTEKLPLGEAIRRNQIDIALTYRTQGGIPLVQQEPGKPESIPDVPGGIMREGTLNRILFGDPTFEPFRATGPQQNSVSVAMYLMGIGMVGGVSVVDPKSPEHWDPYRGSPTRDKVPDMGERIVSSFELYDKDTGIQEIAVTSNLPADVPLTNAEWALEIRRARPPVVWFSLNAPKHADFSKRNLWNEGVQFTLRASLTPTPASAPTHGMMKQ